MAERIEGLNLVLLGKIGAGKSASGNTILGRKAFQSKKSSISVTQDVAVESGTVDGRRVTVYDTPGLSHTDLSEEEIQKIYANVLQSCESDLCVFLLVIKADRFTGKERETVEKIEKLLGEERLKKTWILFTRGDQLEDENKSIDEFINETEPLKRLVQKYDQRYHVFNNKPKGQVQELLTKIYSTYPNTIVRTTMRSRSGVKRMMMRSLSERKRMMSLSEMMSPMSLSEMMSCEEKGAKPKATLGESLEYRLLPPMSQSVSEILPTISEWKRMMSQSEMMSCEGSPRIVRLSVSDDTSKRIVLLGRTGVGKSAAGNTILGQREFRSLRSTNSVTCECSEKHATVSGRSVSVVDTPGLYHTELNSEELEKEIMRSVYLSSPGPHAFLIVFGLDVRFTEEDQQIPQRIKTLFGQEVLKYSIILFTRGDQLKGKPIEKLLQENCRLRDVVGQCGGRFHVFNNRDENNRHQVNDLLQKIDTMIEQNGGGHYSHQMLEDTQRFRREERKQRDEKQRQEEIERAIKETEERVRAEFEGPPRFLQERLKAMRWREEDRKRQEEFERILDHLRSSRRPLAMLMEMKIHMRVEMQRKQQVEKQRREEIERVIKETEERVRAEFEGPPRFLLERLKEMRLREEERKQQVEKQRREEIERVIKETEERVRAEFEGPPRFLQERLKAMRLSVEERIQQGEERQEEFERLFGHRISSMMYMEMQRKLQEEIERVIKETEEIIGEEFKGPPRFLLERLKAMRLSVEERKQQEEERQEQQQKERQEEFERFSDHCHSSGIHEYYHTYAQIHMEMIHKEMQRKQEKIERAIKETEERVRTEFKGPTKFLLERFKAMRLREEDRKQQEGRRGLFHPFLPWRYNMEMQRKLQEEIERAIKETEEIIGEEFEGQPNFLLERLKAMRLSVEERIQQGEERLEEGLDKFDRIFGRHISRRYIEMQIKLQEEIERVIKETEEIIGAEFKGPPRFLLERLKEMRLRVEERKQRVEKRQEERQEEFEQVYRMLSMRSIRDMEMRHMEMEMRHMDMVMRPMEMRRMEMRRMVMRRMEMRHVEMRPMEMRRMVMRHMAMGRIKMRLLEMGLLEMGLLEMGLLEMGLVEMEHVEMEHVEMEHVEMGLVEMEHVEMEHVEMEHVEMEHVEMELVEMEHVEMEHVEMEHVEMIRKEMQIELQEEIERVIKETEEIIRAEFEGPPR